MIASRPPGLSPTAPKGADVVACQTYTVAEAATILGISRATAYECARTGQLPSYDSDCRRLVVPVSALRLLIEDSSAIFVIEGDPIRPADEALRPDGFADADRRDR